MTQDATQTVNKSGIEWELDLARCVQEFALVDHESEARVEDWQEKYLAKRHAVRRAEEEAEHFQYLADMYAKNAKKFSNLASKIKGLALRDMQLHVQTTGEEELKLKDNTRIKLYTRKSKEIACALTGDPIREWDQARLDQLPDSLVRRAPKIGDIKKALIKGGEFDLVLSETKSQHVRWL